MIQAASANSKLLLAAVKAKVILWGLVPPEMIRVESCLRTSTRPSEWRPYHFSWKLLWDTDVFFFGGRPNPSVEPKIPSDFRKRPQKSCVTGHIGRNLQRQAMIFFWSKNFATGSTQQFSNDYTKRWETTKIPQQQMMKSEGFSATELFVWKLPKATLSATFQAF